TLAVRIDKDIPNDDGYIKFSFGKNNAELDVTLYEPTIVHQFAAGPKLLPESTDDNGAVKKPEPAPVETPGETVAIAPTPVLPPDMTHIVVITFRDLKDGTLAADLAKQFADQLNQGFITANIFLRHSTPAPPSTDDLLQRSNFFLQQLQFGQLRGSG